MHAVGWAEAEQHAEMPTHITTADLRHVAHEIWNELQERCDIQKNANLELFLDVKERGVLAFTRRTFLLDDNTWKPSVMFDYYKGVDIEIHFNPDVPNGWYDGTDCDTGWRYDLRTVMRHEMLHGLGLSSSIRHTSTATSVGYTYGASCYPTFYDTQLRSGGVPVVDGCSYVGEQGAVYMAGRKVFVPDDFRAGSSYSHHDETGLFRWQLSPKQCHELGAAEYDMLEGLDYNCTFGRTFVSGGQKLNANLWFISLLSLIIGTPGRSTRSVILSCVLSFSMAFFAF